MSLNYAGKKKKLISSLLPCCVHVAEVWRSIYTRVAEFSPNDYTLGRTDKDYKRQGRFNGTAHEVNIIETYFRFNEVLKGHCLGIS